MALWPLLILWAALVGLAVVAVVVAFLLGAQRDDEDLVEQHRRQMRALTPRRH